MPNVSVRFAESAVADLEALIGWYSDQGLPEVGYRFAEEIVSRIEALRDNPDIGRIVPEFDRPFLRELIHPPFRIVYHRDPGQVRIVRVWRSERLLALPEEEPA